MIEMRGEPRGNNIERLRTSTLEAVRILDPELFLRPDTRHLVELGALIIGQVTSEYGSPDYPLWYKGVVEDRPMTYHNGGEDGHTSAGAQGLGVPRATLIIAREVNKTAGYEVYDPLSRSINFYAATAHDRFQNCGRSLLPEGQGEGRGDERMSAEMARSRLQVDIPDSDLINPSTPQRAYNGVMATAFNPQTDTQNIDYEAFEADPDNPAVQQEALDKEAVAGADLLIITHERGLRSAVENIVELLASNFSKRALQPELKAAGVNTTGVADMGRILDVIGAHETLLERFTQLIEGRAKFLRTFKFSDRAIRRATGGRGIDDLFPGRAEKAIILVGLGQALRSGSISPREAWEQTRAYAGYQ